MVRKAGQGDGWLVGDGIKSLEGEIDSKIRQTPRFRWALDGKPGHSSSTTTLACTIGAITCSGYGNARQHAAL